MPIQDIDFHLSSDLSLTTTTANSKTWQIGSYYTTGETLDGLWYDSSSNSISSSKFTEIGFNVEYSRAGYCKVYDSVEANFSNILVGLSAYTIGEGLGIHLNLYLEEYDVVFMISTTRDSNGLITASDNVWISTPNNQTIPAGDYTLHSVAAKTKTSTGISYDAGSNYLATGIPTTYTKIIDL